MPWNIPARPVVGDTDWNAEQEAIWSSLKAFVDGLETSVSGLQTGATQQEAVGDPFDREMTVEKQLAIHNNNAVNITAGSLYLMYFTARASRTVSAIGAAAHTTPAAGLTLARSALYSAAANDDLTLLAASANNTSAYTVAHQFYDEAITPTAITKGNRYAVGMLVTGTTPGQRKGITSANSDTAFANRTPRMLAVLTSQTDIPASILASALSTTPSMAGIYAEVF